MMGENGTVRRRSSRREKLLEWMDAPPTVASEEIQLSRGMEWFVERLGRLPNGVNLLLSGDPGVGKSTLALQLAAAAATAGEKVLYISTEQTREAVMARLDQVNSATRARKYLTIKDDIYDLTVLPQFLTHQVLRPTSELFGMRLIVIDSLQGCGLGAQDAPTWRAVFDFLRQASGAGVSVMCLAHMTKAKAIAGPRALEHACDATLLLRHGVSCRAFSIPKNRFGPARLDPVGLTINPATTRLEPSPLGVAATSSVRTLTSTGLVDIEVAITPARHDRGYIKAPGLSIKEIEIIVDLLERSSEEARFAWALGITVRAVGGLRFSRDHSLPVALAIMCAFRRQQIAEQYVVFGDVDLRGNVLPLSLSTAATICDLQAAGVLDERTLLCGPVPEEVRDELSDVRRHTIANILNLSDQLWKE